MILIQTHNGPRPGGTTRREMTSSCRISRQKPQWVKVSERLMGRVILVEFDCHQCVGLINTGARKIKNVK